MAKVVVVTGGAPNSLAVSPDGKTLAALTADGGVSLRVFDLGPAEGQARHRMISTVTPTSTAAQVRSAVRTGNCRREPRARHAQSPSDRPRWRVGPRYEAVT